MEGRRDKGEIGGLEVKDGGALQHTGERERDEKGKLTKAPPLQKKTPLIYFIQWILKTLKRGA